MEGGGESSNRSKSRPPQRDVRIERENNGGNNFVHRRRTFMQGRDSVSTALDREIYICRCTFRWINVNVNTILHRVHRFKFRAIWRSVRSQDCLVYELFQR